MLDMTRAYGLNFLFPERDEAVGKALKDHGEFAPAEVGFLAAYMNHFGRDGCFVDVGANIGAISLPLARGRDSWRFIAVEAHRGLAQVLSANALSNGLYNVEVQNVVAGDAEGIIDFPATSLSGSGNFGILGLHMGKEEPTERARVSTLDLIAPENTRLIKIDVEGHEASVLSGAETILRTSRPVVLCEAAPKHEVANRQARAILKAAGYDLFWFYSPFVSLAKPRKRLGMPIPKTGDGGVVALPAGVPNLWNLPPIGSVDEPWPQTASTYAYLKNYGF